MASGGVAHRNDQAPSGKLDPTWRQLFIDFPERFMVGTDTYTPERWHYVVEHASYSRQWLAECLLAELADNIAFRNAERLAARTWGNDGWVDARNPNGEQAAQR